MNKIRIRYDNLIKENNYFLLLGKKFTGLAYKFSGGGAFEALYEIINGVIIKKSDDLYELPSNGLRVDYDYLEFDTEYYQWASFQGKPFTGISYEFQEEYDGVIYMDSESGFSHSAQQGPDRSWYSNGQMYKESIGGIHQTWFDDGDLKVEDKRVNGISVFEIRYDDDKQLEYLLLKDEKYFNMSNLYVCKLSNKLYLFGEKISNKIFDHLRKNNHFENIDHLWLSNSSVTDNGLFSGDLSSLSKLELTSNKNIALPASKILKNKYKSCEIIYDDGGEDGPITLEA